MINPVPKVLVRVLCYNQVDTINRCIKSVLNQKGSFDLTLVVGDDCSDDGTFEVLQSFASGDSRLIVNQTKTNNLTQNSISNWRLCLTKEFDYIAFLEGDDFWCDSLKLMKQINFFTKHEGYSVCATQYKEGNFDKSSYKFKGRRGRYNLGMYLNLNGTHINTALIKYEAISDLPEELLYIPYTDKFIISWALRKGKLFVLKDYTLFYSKDENTFGISVEKLDENRNFLRENKKKISRLFGSNASQIDSFIDGKLRSKNFFEKLQLYILYRMVFSKPT